MHRGGRLVPIENPKADTMPGVWVGTHHEVHEGTLMPHAWDRYRNRLESAAGQPCSTPTSGVRREISMDDEAVPLPLPWMPSILPHV